MLILFFVYFRHRYTAKCFCGCLEKNRFSLGNLPQNPLPHMHFHTKLPKGVGTCTFTPSIPQVDTRSGLCLPAVFIDSLALTEIFWFSKCCCWLLFSIIKVLTQPWSCCFGSCCCCCSHLCAELKAMQATARLVWFTCFRIIWPWNVIAPPLSSSIKLWSGDCCTQVKYIIRENRQYHSGNWHGHFV